MKHRLALAIGLVLAAVLGVLGILHGMAPDPDAIRAALSAQIERLPEDPVQRDRRLEELMEVEDYRIHARALWLKLERLHGPAHQAAKADVDARKTVASFLDRNASLDGNSQAELSAIYDELRALLDAYGRGPYGPALNKFHARLAPLLAPSCNDLDHFRVLQEAQKDRLAGKFASALRRIEDCLRKHPGCEQFRIALGKEREALLKSSSQAAEKLLEQARKENSATLLERALPDYAGLPDEGRLKAQLTESRRR